MTRITTSDHVLMMVQEQLDRLGKDRSARATRAPGTRSQSPDPMTRLRALVAREAVSDDELKRALVRGLLMQQLGEALANDPAFEAITGDVIRIIGDSASGRVLLDQALRQLESG